MIRTEQKPVGHAAEQFVDSLVGTKLANVRIISCIMYNSLFINNLPANST